MTLIAGSALAGEVNFSISAHETYIGAPITIQIQITNAQEHDLPVFPEVDGAEVRERGAQTSQFTSIVNGRVEKRSTVTYTFDVIPRRIGKLRIPSIVVTVDGEESRTQAIDIKVLESDAGDLLYVHVLSDRQSVFVGEPIDATLEIWIKQFANNRIRLNENDMFRTIDQANSNFGPFTDAFKPNRFTRGEEQVRFRKERRTDDDGNSNLYFVYTLQHRVWPERPGAFDAGGISVLVRYPVKVERDSFSFFGRHNITKTRPITAFVENSEITIKPLPLDNRPASFRGAVGRYRITSSAKPNIVYVGDPITLTITIMGAGRLDLLQPPALSEQESLISDFRVPDETIAGVVAGGAKVFTQSIRAKNTSVTEIPPIEFSYFNPETESYTTTRTKPIPITVREVSRVSVANVVDGGTQPEAPTRLTTLDRGLLANENDIETLMLDQRYTPGWRTYTLLGSMPAIYLACLVTIRRRERFSGDLSSSRKRNARRNALAAINHASRADNPIDDIASAITAYVADRYNLPTGGLTREEALRKLSESQCPTVTLEAVDALLSECESAKYAGLTQATGSDMADRAKTIINDLERWRPRR